MESPDADPIIAEIPVFLSKSLEGLLHVFSFPLRRSNRPYEMNDVALEVTELNPASASTSDNANDPRSLGLLSSSSSASKQTQKNIGNHPNSDQVVVGVRPKFTLQCGFDISGAVGASSFTGRDPLLDAKNQKKIISTTGHVSTLGEDQPFGDLITTTTTSIGTDGAFGGMGGGIGGVGGMGGGSGSFGNNSSNMYNYRLESTPAPQHASYACAVFYRGAVHLTPITGIHQFFPKPLVDRNLELTLGSEGNMNQSSNGSSMSMNQNQNQNQQQQQQPPQQQYYQPRLAPRSIAMAKASENTTRIDFLPVEHPDAIPIAQRLMYSSYLVSNTNTSNNNNNNHQTSSDASSPSPSALRYQPLPAGAVEVSRTAGDMARSSSDPGRDDEEMMWGLQAFFPFIDSSGNGGDRRHVSSSSAAALLAASSKQQIALKFAQQAMGIDEQVATIVAGSKLAGCEDVQRNVSLPNSREPVTIPRLVQALLRCSVCVQGVWACFWDASCSGIGAFVREFLLYCFAVADNEENNRKYQGSVAARDIFDLCGLNGGLGVGAGENVDEAEQNKNNNNAQNSEETRCNSNLRKTIRSMLPLLATLNPETKRWTIRNYNHGKNISDLKKASKETRAEYENQLSGWIRRKDQVLANMRVLARGDVPPKSQLALRAVYAAAVRGHLQQQQQQTSSSSSASSTLNANNNNNKNNNSNSNNTNPQSSAQQQQQNLKNAIRLDELARCRRFVRIAFELHGVVNKMLFKERILNMSKTRDSSIFTVSKEVLQETLKDELMGFTESTWILKNPADSATAGLRPYFIRAVLGSGKSSYTTKEIEQAAFQLIHEDPNQTVVGNNNNNNSVRASSSGSTSSSSSAKNQNNDNNNANEDAAAAVATAVTTTSANATATTKQHITISAEHHNVAVRIINELSTFHRGEKMWHVKTGVVQFLAIS